MLHFCIKFNYLCIWPSTQGANIDKVNKVMLSILYVNDYQIPVCGSKILNNIVIDLNLITIKYKFDAYEMFILFVII